MRGMLLLAIARSCAPLARPLRRLKTGGAALRASRSTATTDDFVADPAGAARRRARPDAALRDVGLDPASLDDDARLRGSSALRTYRSFVLPKSLGALATAEAPQRAATIANQVAFQAREAVAAHEAWLVNVDRAAALLHGPSYQRRLGEIARKKEKEANCKRELVQRAQRQAQHIAAQKAEKFLQEQRAKLVGEGHEDGDDLAGSRRLSVRNMSRDERARQLQLREVVKKLHDAAKAHDIATVRAMVKLRPECANGTDKSGATALIHACWDGPLEMCELIVASGCDVNGAAR